MKHRVAITGIGIVSVLGISVSEVAQALWDGKSGIVAEPGRKSLGFASCLTGSVPPFPPSLSLSKKQRKTMPDFVQWAAEACRQAIKQSGIDPEALRNGDSGVIFGCDSSCMSVVEQAQLLLEKKNTAGLGSGLVFRSMTSCISMNLGTLFKIQGACWTLSAACASSGHAVGQAADLIAFGRQERILCGGAQEINWQSMCSFDALGAFSSRENCPHTASRPFDAERDGLVPSGGAAALLLERYDVAEKRGAVILGEVAGYGFSSDGENISVPSEHGLGRAMRMALATAGARTEEVGYICAHATSTPVGDSVEARNIVGLFGERTVPVSSTKSMTGHELWMSGAAQAVYSTIMAGREFLAPNINFETPDEWSAKLDIITKARPAAPRIILCNSAGFGGTNASLLLRFARQR
ncbi:MAG: beta-ketoacyl-[acyl-carrier-protein] synthase family protein [Desulfovibrio sp.]|jgi:3-oxoacyl-[acyl-carrier-protein] synthase-1|nr:beta-ketoacyl-[acyl-carrier-protein] synthase family protein [Desulfovibrio sp.]